MAEKKSLAQAMEQAQQISANNPEITVFVMDKPKRKAVVCCFAWVYEERLLDGYTTYCKYRGGVKVNA